MAFKQVQDLDAEVTTALGGTSRKTGKKNPSQVEGYYLGSKTVANSKGGTPSQLHILQTPEGNLGIWGKADLNKKLLNVKPGAMVRLTHTGMQATPKGEMYKYRVEQDEDNAVEVAPLSLAQPKVDLEDSYEDESEEESEESDVAASVAQPALAASSGKVDFKELLKRNRK
jgi:hypothetical protein